MTAQAAARTRKTRDGKVIRLPVKAAAQIWQNGIVAVLAGQAIAGRAAATYAELATLRVVGLAASSVLGGGADGAETVEADRVIALFANSAAGDAITSAQIGGVCFLVDDQTVAKTVGNGLRPIAGEIVDVGAEGVWVEVGRSAALGPRKIRLPFVIPQTELLAGTPIEVVSPVDGAIVGMTAIVQTAVTTGGPITAAVGVTAVDGLSCVIADAATKGTVVSDTPTAGHASTAVTAGGRIQIVPDASFAAAGAVNGFVEITY